ncbi:MAG: hypothetical protein A2Z25_12445 [Planctomycetes bacterium RBG_16_55_9]|nr:MAG: hypothetical protein A2Z25_12445 [Planctomycetes bacterium RBG_16_55_9]
MISSFAQYHNPIHLLLWFFGPFVGVVWYLKYANSVTSQVSQRYGAMATFILSYLALASAFAVTYLSWNKFLTSGNQILYKGECINGYFTLVYFSLVTGTTLGYGDMWPEGFARIPVCMQMLLFLCFVTLALIHIQNIYSLSKPCFVCPHQVSTSAIVKTHPQEKHREK